MARTPIAISRSCGRALLPTALLLAGALAGCGKNNVFAPVIPPLSALVVSPASDTLRVGLTRQFTATAYDTSGNPIAVPVSWGSTNPGVFTVDARGRVTGAGEGVALLLAEAGTRSDTATVFVYPDTGWFVQPGGSSNLNLNGVFFLADGRNGWVVGDAGTILHTSDAGSSWNQQLSGTSFGLNAVWFTSTLEGWAVGQSGTVLHTTSGGSTWSRVLSANASENLLDLTFATRDTGWAVGTLGAIVRTFDRGQTWKRVHPTGNALHSVAFYGTRDGWAVGNGGVITGTHDRGETWFIVQPSVTSQTLRGVWRRSEPMAWAAGDQGVAPRTVAGPDSTRWELRSAGALNQLDGLCFPTDLIGYAVGFNGGGLVLRTDDGGLTWETQDSHSGFRLHDVFFVDPLRGWAVGDNGVIVHTARGGRR